MRVSELIGGAETFATHQDTNQSVARDGDQSQSPLNNSGAAFYARCRHNES